MMAYKCQIVILWSISVQLISHGSVASERDLTVNLYSDAGQDDPWRSRVKRSLSDGLYCWTRGCCPQRDDSCRLPYYEKNATCYCDLFCDKEPVGHVDCCPDFWTACRGEEPPQLHTQTAPVTASTTPLELPGCFRDGVHYEEESVIKENCNYCICISTQWKCTESICLIRPEQIEEINARNYGWTAENYSMFWGLTLEEGFKQRLGTLPPSPGLLAMNEMTGRVTPEDDFPLFFIASYKWPDWIHGPLNQQNCGASWAFSTASVAADRIAIHSNGIFTGNLSPQNLISCSSNNQYGCNGGSVDSAWWYLRKHGLVSHACYPFAVDYENEYMSCDMPSAAKQHGKRYATGPCPNAVEQSNNVYQCSPPYRVSSNESEIMKEIMENGPVQALMQVHEDFFLYKTGIYQHTDATIDYPGQFRIRGTHSVKITGLSLIPGESLGVKMGISGFYEEKMNVELKQWS
ncbi:tubulointerstitial nephritis antigen isoform X2 [Ambystoma mexicanum]|uniref:tubulointerstitial nephritis antigen isoform X2 n=1 Tax=Ambystoma mexicanum TaxID=8296 RepID=UPI0037E72073